MSQSDASNPTATRRELLRSAVRMSAALSAVGLSSSAFLTPGPARAGADDDAGCGGLSPDDPVYLLVRHAVDTCDLEQAIALYADAAGLSDAEISALRTIKRADLESFARLRKLLASALDEATGGLAITITVHCDI